MANILEFLRVLLTDEDDRARFAAEPAGYLAAADLEHLSGEDVAEAIPALLPSLPPKVAKRLAPYTADPEDGALPPVRPLAGESDVDAAVRQLLFATSLVRGAKMHDEGHEVEPAAAFERERSAEAAAEEQVEEELEHEDRAPSGDETVDRFAEELAVIARVARQRLDELTREAAQRRDEIVRAAEGEAATIRARAEEEGRHRANELVQNAKSEADGIVAAAGARRDEVERQLRERLEGVQSLLRSFHEADPRPGEGSGPA